MGVSVCKKKNSHSLCQFAIVNTNDRLFGGTHNRHHTSHITYTSASWGAEIVCVCVAKANHKQAAFGFERTPRHDRQARTHTCLHASAVLWWIYDRHEKLWCKKTPRTPHKHVLQMRRAKSICITHMCYKYTHTHEHAVASPRLMLSIR